LADYVKNASPNQTDEDLGSHDSFLIMNDGTCDRWVETFVRGVLRRLEVNTSAMEDNIRRAFEARWDERCEALQAKYGMIIPRNRTL
jgi:hypothetical protein